MEDAKEILKDLMYELVTTALIVATTAIIYAVSMFTVSKFGLGKEMAITITAIMVVVVNYKIIASNLYSIVYDVVELVKSIGKLIW